MDYKFKTLDTVLASQAACGVELPFTGSCSVVLALRQLI